MGEELHEILQNSSNEEYTENKHSEGINADIDKEVDETKGSAFQGKDDGKKTIGSCRCFTYNQPESFV